MANQELDDYAEKLKEKIKHKQMLMRQLSLQQQFYVLFMASWSGDIEKLFRNKKNDKNAILSHIAQAIEHITNIIIEYDGIISSSKPILYNGDVTQNKDREYSAHNDCHFCCYYSHFKITTFDEFIKIYEKILNSRETNFSYILKECSFIN